MEKGVNDSKLQVAADVVGLNGGSCLMVTMFGGYRQMHLEDLLSGKVTTLLIFYDCNFFERTASGYIDIFVFFKISLI